MRLFSALLSTLLLPGLASAQADVDARKAELGLSNSSPRIFDQLFYSPATVSGPNIGASRNVMPLWSTPDGRILAIVAMGPDANSIPALAPAPQIVTAADLKLIDVTDFVSGGVGIKLRDNASAYARLDEGVVLSPSYSNSNSLGCNPAFGHSPDGHCLAFTQRANNGSFHVGSVFNAGNLDVDLSYGLSWLRANDQEHLTGATQQPFWDLFGGMNANGVPTLVIPGIELASVQNSGFSATGRWHFDENQSMDLSAAIGRIQLELPGNTTLLPNLNQAALTVGVRRGDFSGMVVGHVVGPADLLSSGQRWSSLDLGISWRAPWRGVFSVGAQNLWSSGSAPSLIDPAAPHEVDPGQSRVPYVQYHQDL